MSTIRTAGTAGVLALCLAGAASPSTLPDGFVEEVVIDGLLDPSTFAFAPDGRMFITERVQGRLRVAHLNEATGAWTLQPAPFATLDIPVDGDGNPEAHNSSGLRGFTFDPEFAANGFVYCFYMKNAPRHNRVVRIAASAGDPDVAAPGETLLIELPFAASESSGSHNGGALRFGTDGFLYITTGDGWNGGDTVQSLATYTGKVFRIGADGSIPKSNPFYDEATGPLRAIYALGLRNPGTMSRHPVTGQLYVNDVAGSNKASVFELVAAANYGHDGYGGIGESTGAWIDAGAGSSTGRVITGGDWYDGDVFPGEFAGRCFVSLWGGNGSSAGRIRTIAADDDPSASDFATGIGHVDPGGTLKPTSIAVGPDGSVYYMASSYQAASGKVFRIRYDSCADIDGDGVVAVGDLVLVIQSWGPCAGECPADVDGSGEVDSQDLSAVIVGWGPC